MANTQSGKSGLERLCNDEAYLDALGAKRIPDPTTAGDFCRRFGEADIETLMNTINAARLSVWQDQPESFRDEAIIDVDGTLTPTTGECKEGMEVSYKKCWGYHPLIVSLAQTGEPLFIKNRPGNRPSYEGAAWYLDRAARLCRQADLREFCFAATRILPRRGTWIVGTKQGIASSSASIHGRL
jgi:hypothetical protein